MPLGWQWGGRCEISEYLSLNYNFKFFAHIFCRFSSNQFIFSTSKSPIAKNAKKLNILEIFFLLTFSSSAQSAGHIDAGLRKLNSLKIIIHLFFLTK
jgi:hypothetical protein